MISKINFTGLHGVYTAENKKNLAKLIKHTPDNFGNRRPVEALDEALEKINYLSGDKDLFLKTSSGVSEVYNRNFVELAIEDENGRTITNAISVNGYPYQDNYNVLNKLANIPLLDDYRTKEVPEELAVILNKYI